MRHTFTAQQGSHVNPYHQYLDSATGVLYVTITGLRPYTELHASIDQYATALPVATSCLVDLRDATYQLTDLQLEDLARRITPQLKLRCSILLAEGTTRGLFTHYATLAQLNPSLVLVTTSLAEANAWLGLPV